MAVYVGLRETQGDEFGTRYNDRREANNVAGMITIGPEMSPGWLLKVGAYASGRGGSVGARMCIWDANREAGAELMWQSPQQSWGSSLSWRTANLSPAVRLKNNNSYWVGFWANNTSYGNQYRVNYNTQTNMGNRGWKEFAGQPAPNFVNYQPGDPPGPIVCYLFYEPNDDPGIGSWMGPTTSTGSATLINSSTPTFSGTTPHPNDGQYDYTDSVHLQIWREDTNAIVHEETFQVTSAMRSSKTFSRTSSVLPTGVNLKARFRHRDSWGVFSPWSTTIRFTCARGPLAPSITVPNGRHNAVSGFNYQGVYTHDVELPSNAVQIRVLNESGTQVLYDSGTVIKTVAHNTSWTHAAWHSALQWGVKYSVEVRFRSRNELNNADVWGPYKRVSFYTNSAPYKPSELTPSGNRNTGETTLIATMRDPDGDTVTQAQIELFNITTNSMVGGYPKIVSSIAAGRLTHNATTDLVVDNSYRWRVRASDSFVYGEYSDWATFVYRAAPNVSFVHPAASGIRNRVDDPSAEYDETEYWTESNRVESGANQLSPNQASVETDLTGLSPFTTTGTLPNLTRITTDWYEGGASARVFTNGGTDSGLITTVTANHILNPSEQNLQASAWVKATPGVTLGCRTVEYNAAGTLVTYGPETTLIASGNWEYIVAGAIEPSAESKVGLNVYIKGVSSGQNLYVDAMMAGESTDLTDWVAGSWGSPAYIDVTVEGDESYGDAASGLRSWRAVEGHLSTNTYTSPFEEVDPTAPYLFAINFKKESGTSITHFRIDCYNSSDTLLTSLYPNSLAGAAGVDVNTYWSAYGGIVWHSASTESVRFPATTAKVKIVVIPSQQSTATLRFDAVSMYRVPIFSAAEWQEAQRWFGYIDGDSEEYGDVVGDLAYSWAGLVGQSDSFGPPVARGGNLSLWITYAHPTAKAKEADKLVLYRAIRGEYVKVYESDWGGGTRTKIPMPTDQVKSDARYRVVLSVRDTQGIVTEMPSLLFDVRFDGPPELNIFVARAEPESAEVHLGFDQTSLGVSQFGGIEVAVGDDREVVDLITDPGTTEYVYPYPLSGESTAYWVRQIENRGNDQVESRWDRRDVTVDYDLFWLKDVEDPYNIALPVKVYAQDEPTMDHTAPMQSYKPWGEDTKVHIVGRTRESNGTITVRLLDHDADIIRKMEILDAIKQRRKVMCLLSQRPPQRRFVMITGISHTPAHVPFYAIYKITYEVSSYAESYYERAGIYQS